MRRPPLELSSDSCLASRRLCKANASRGESSGGASPATWRRGERRDRDTEACEVDRKSMKLGRVFDILRESGAVRLSGSPCDMVSREMLRPPVQAGASAAGWKLVEVRRVANSWCGFVVVRRGMTAVPKYVSRDALGNSARVQNKPVCGLIY